MEITDVETGRVLSDYVKKIRIEEKQGKLRSANLITELISAEEAKGNFWDSGALFGVFQKSGGGGGGGSKGKKGAMGANMTVGKRSRESGGASGYSSRYPKEVFIKLVKEELLRIKEEGDREEEAKGGLTKEEKEEMSNNNNDNANDLVAKKRRNLTKKQQHELKLSDSAAAYEKRKRDKYLAIITESERIEGSNIEIFDVGSQSWEQMRVEKCVVTWVENGTKPHILHSVQRLGGDNEPIGEVLKVSDATE